MMYPDNQIMREVLSERITAQEGMARLKEMLESCQEHEYGRIASAYRVCRSIVNIVEGANTWVDFCGNLRQAIFIYNQDVLVSERIYNNIKESAHYFKIACHRQDENKLYKINAHMGFPKWLGETDGLVNCYNQKPIKRFNSPVGDFSLYNMTGFKYYKSQTQKALIQAAMNMPDGSTLLGCMPTGEGKSLVGLMPQFYEDKGTSIVIVPTISLAIDQSNSAKRLYKDREYVPIAYHSELPEGVKSEIIEGLRKGKLPILFISPEALLNSSFSKVVLDMAEKGQLNRLVIDEAHIVEDWGEQFRTEFQLLSVYRRKLLKASNNKLKTILLSATLTKHCVDLLKSLFSEGDNYIEIRGDALRPEIQYYIDVNRTNIQRLSKLKEVILLLPRPIIVYVIRPDDARLLKRELNDIGLHSVDTFTGDISSRTQREDLMDRWNDNDIDIMIATSAFGMGVDKKDIRTVIHYCIPESMNRFYQEVGRSGRDRIPSISLLLTMPSHDMEDTIQITSSKNLTVDKFIGRWKAMKTQIIDRVDGNTIWVDTSIKPSYIDEDEITGRLSASWNEYVLLQLFRHGFIDILDMEVDHTRTKNILIRIKDEIVDNLDELSKIIDQIRGEDIKRSKQKIKEMKDLSTNYLFEDCIARQLKRIYYLAPPSCGGCQYCRSHNMEPRILRNDTDYMHGKKIITDSLMKRKDSAYEDYFDIKNNIVLQYENLDLNSHQINIILENLLKVGVDSIVLGSESLYREFDFEGLSYKPNKYCSIITNDELKDEYNDIVIAGTIAILYGKPNESNMNLNLYNLSLRWVARGNRVIHVIDKELGNHPENQFVRNIDAITKHITTNISS
ncbi:MAG: DEAD/DEAH box helicase [Caldicoprobacterales bacterium]